MAEIIILQLCNNVSITRDVTVTRYMYMQNNVKYILMLYIGQTLLIIPIHSLILLIKLQPTKFIYFKIHREFAYYTDVQRSENKTLLPQTKLTQRSEGAYSIRQSRRRRFCPNCSSYRPHGRLHARLPSSSLPRCLGFTLEMRLR